jgi:hypothetical protein
MKKIYFLITVLVLIGVSTNIQAQKVQKSPKAVLTQTVGLTDVSITYFRPGLKGRPMTDLAKEGKVWRTGANNATELKVSNPITIGGKELAAGTYSLYSMPNYSGDWTIIINTKLSWGTGYSDSDDVMRFSAKASKTAESTETMTIGIADINANGKDAAIEIRWGNTSVKVPFSVSK